jgi:hypothetical protein
MIKNPYFCLVPKSPIKMGITENIRKSKTIMTSCMCPLDSHGQVRGVRGLNTRGTQPASHPLRKVKKYKPKATASEVRSPINFCFENQLCRKSNIEVLLNTCLNETMTQRVAKSCLSLPTNSALAIRVQMRGEGWSCVVLANEYSCAHHVTWSPNKFGDLPPYLT